MELSKHSIKVTIKNKYINKKMLMLLLTSCSVELKCTANSLHNHMKNTHVTIQLFTMKSQKILTNKLGL